VVTVVLLMLAGRVAVSEVMANPAGASGAHGPEDRNEFVELYNSGPEAVDLLDWTLDDLDAVDRLAAWRDSTLLDSNPTLVVGTTWLAAGGYAVVLDAEYTDPEPAGGQVRPYRFGDGTLILTTGNTTLGNGLAVNDPVIIASPWGDTSTYGTPADPGDSIPANPGDGLSWERIDPAGPDAVANWAVCHDSSGSTPGRPNSITQCPDLAVADLAVVSPDSLIPGGPFECLVAVANLGFVVTSDWQLSLYLDVSGNGAHDPGEPRSLFNGWRLAAGTDSAFRTTWSCPDTRTELWARLDCPGDLDTADNRRRISVGPTAAELLRPLVAGFTPDEDGFEDTLRFAYRLPEPGGRLRVVVYDLAGRQVRELLDDEPGTDEGTIDWDGSDDLGRPAAPGVYAVWYRYLVAGAASSGRLPIFLFRR